MFRWCAYCQRLLGEALPLDDYRVTHGVCPRCEDLVLTFRSTTAQRADQELHRRIFSRWHTREVVDARVFVDEALARGVLPSEILIGILQPALYEIGEQWKRGIITVADEHRFSAWCETVLALLDAPADPADAEVVLACLPGNTHTLGLRFLRVYLRDQGIRARSLPLGLSADQIVASCVRNPPRLLGFSVSMPHTVNGAVDLAHAVEDLTGATIVLGGFAFRRTGLEPGDCHGIPVLRQLDDVLPFLGGFHARS